MANRSHLYSVDTFPTKASPPKPIRGLSEWNWDIPLSHKILMGHGAVACTSVIWGDHEIGALANFERGVSTFLAFLGALGAERERAEAEAFLTKQKGKFLLLEAGEIFDISGEPLIDGVNRLVDHDIPAVAGRVAAVLGGGETAWRKELAANPTESLGLTWSEVLYYSFD